MLIVCLTIRKAILNHNLMILSYLKFLHDEKIHALQPHLNLCEFFMVCYYIKSANQNGARAPWAIALTRAAVSKTKHKLKQNFIIPEPWLMINQNTITMIMTDLRDKQSWIRKVYLS